MIGHMVMGGKGLTAAPEFSRCPVEPEAELGLGVHVCFSTTDGLLSKIIRLATRARVSHCLITYRCPTFQKNMVLEVQGRGFVMTAWDGWEKKNKLMARYSISLPDAEIQPALASLADLLGAAYDRLSLFGHLLRIVGRLKRNPIDSKERLVCSEAVALFLSWIGVSFEHIGSVTPRKLVTVVEAQPELFELAWAARDFKPVQNKAKKAARPGADSSDPSPVG